MLDLYHNGVSTCSQKVRMVLAEKALDFVSHLVDLIKGEQHDPAYVKLNPNHVVPTLVHDGAVLIESSLINEYLDDVFPDVPMRPADALGRHAAGRAARQGNDAEGAAMVAALLDLGEGAGAPVEAGERRATEGRGV